MMNDVTTDENVAQTIERMLMEAADLYAGFLPKNVDERAWQHLLIYAPDHLLAERYWKLIHKRLGESK